MAQFRSLSAALIGAGALAGALAASATSAPADAPRPVAVQAEPGKGAAAARALRAGGLRVQRRRGDSLQVSASPSRVGAIERLGPVASAAPAPTAFPDQEVVLSEGLDRTGAGVYAGAARTDPLGNRVAADSDLTIAVMDLGFGINMDRRQADGELPPRERLETRAFDPVAGLAGRNAYGNATNHGELVAQTVYDYAPNAKYIFVSYQTPLDFVAAVDWLIQRRPDIVVHSNSFIEGPFDGTSPAAQAVNRAAGAGILWFNSAGNYASRHWAGGWNDPDGDGVHDWPSDTEGQVFYRAARKPITFAVSWAAPPGATEPVDLDIAVERLVNGSDWTPVATSAERQSAGASPSERITGHLPAEEGFFRLVVRRVSGPAPSRMTVFSREIPLHLMGGSPVGSTPTPGDATGAISVGAVDWRGDAPKAYSSQGPTWDGRLKPDIVAPTDTRVSAGDRRRQVGGTSNSAPNAAGAAAILLATLRRQGIAANADTIRSLLIGNALDLGEPGPDMAYGAGRVRIHAKAPRLVRLDPKPKSAIRKVVKLNFRPVSKARLTRWTLEVDGKQIGGRRRLDNPNARIDTRRLEDGWHLVRVAAADWPGNLGVREFGLRVDNTRPKVAVGRGRVRARSSGTGVASVPLRVDDEGTTGRMLATVTVTRRDGSTSRTRRVRVAPSRSKEIGLGRLRRGSYLVVVNVTDPAGNERTARRNLTV